MADQNVNGLPLAALPLLGTDKIVVTRDGVNLNQATVADLPSGGGSVSGVTSFSGRTGAVSPTAADYDAFFLTPAEANSAYRIAAFDESTELTESVKSFVFTGAGVTATHTGGAVTVTVPGGGAGTLVAVESNGTVVVPALEVLNFTGAGVSVTSAPSNEAVIDIPGPSADTALTTQPNTFTAAQVVAQVSVPFSATLNIDASLGNAFSIAALTGNTTLAAPTNLVSGGTYLFIFRQDATGGRMVTFNPVFRFLSGVTQIDQTANAISMVGAYYDGTNLITNIVKENV